LIELPLAKNYLTISKYYGKIIKAKIETVVAMTGLYQKFQKCKLMRDWKQINLGIAIFI